ncbi:MAG: hypothetical protein COU29_00060 [Candidatus Magasanikbacteria bacterium CG10_big_fil_rev_8_21_14_0_10_36_32]|uniref:Uncharacterized protein n=1 Tax=Candidatus Magasanikbacteria bacterium CG10_big_fil_rev_8_21_14_0_10_36_32 TaxID=1974646 RepID=A0A2M6W7H0_9BACT|nr:MAG: hypothetical protein COU29_00060 [Candidatus Magasanikbacteria bacterium CG10_big_fil_rev_8_21_14_0_10_36_32]
MSQTKIFKTDNSANNETKLEQKINDWLKSNQDKIRIISIIPMMFPIPKTGFAGISNGFFESGMAILYETID